MDQPKEKKKLPEGLKSSELHKLPQGDPVVREQGYRCGYRDGWGKAIISLQELIDGQGFSFDEAFKKAFDLWLYDLPDWKAKDCSKEILAPEIKFQTNKSCGTTEEGQKSDVP